MADNVIPFASTLGQRLAQEREFGAQRLADTVPVIAGAIERMREIGCTSQEISKALTLAAALLENRP